MRLSSGSTGWGVSLAIATLVVAGVAWRLTGGALFSPGSLSAAAKDTARLGGVASHADLERRCPSCHPPPFSRASMSERCIDCHEDIGAELKDSNSLHGALQGSRACLRCHTEHGGRSASLTRYAVSGLAHGRFGFLLDSHRHTAAGRPFGCADCHGGGSFRFQDSRCVTCHREYQADFLERHVQTWGSECRACHDGADRFSRSRFRHDTTGFPLTGRHQQSECGGCHPGARALEGFRSAPGDCLGCHRADDTHRGGFGSDCSACHGTDSWKGARFDHRFPLNHGGGGRIACSTCHTQAGNWKSYTCYGCHEHTRERILRKHQEEGVVRNLDDCVRCHATGREEEGEEEGGED